MEGSAGLERDAFIADGWRLSWAWFLVFSLPIVAILDLFLWQANRGSLFGSLALATGIAFVAATVAQIWGLAHRKQPVVELSSERPEFASLLQFAKRRTLGLDEFAGVALDGRRLLVKTKAGATAAINVHWLSDLSHRLAFQSLEGRIVG